MDKATTILITLIAYKVVLLGIGFWAGSRTRSTADFFLGGRGLGPLVAAVSYCSSASSAWTLLGVSGIAYVIGLPALWLVGGSVLGMFVAWFWMAPRMQAFTRKHGYITLTEVVGHGCSGRMRTWIAAVASLIVVCTFVFYVAAQFQGAGNTFAASFNLSIAHSILIGAAIIMIYTLVGGFWAVSVTDTVQGLLMALTALLLPLAALLELGGVGGFLDRLAAVSAPEQLSLTAGNLGLAALGVVFGGLAMNFGTYGQPHLLVRFMALRDGKALRQARLITIGWYFLVFSGMCFLGLAGRILHLQIDNPETIFFLLTDTLFTPVVGAVLLAAVLSAIMSTADSQLLVAASALSHDLGLGGNRPRRSLLISRLTIAALVVLAVLVALYLPESIFSRVAVAWIALGAAFGPTVILRLAGLQLRPLGVLLSIGTGFGLSVLFYLLPDTPGDILERMGPILSATLVLLPFASRPSPPRLACATS